MSKGGGGHGYSSRIGDNAIANLAVFAWRPRKRVVLKNAIAPMQLRRDLIFDSQRVRKSAG